MGVGAYNPKHYNGEALDSIDFTVKDSDSELQQSLEAYMESVRLKVEINYPEFASNAIYQVYVQDHGDDTAISVVYNPVVVDVLLESHGTPFQHAAELGAMPSQVKSVAEETMPVLEKFLTQSLLRDGYSPAYRTGSYSTYPYTLDSSDDEIDQLAEQLQGHFDTFNKLTTGASVMQAIDPKNPDSDRASILDSLNSGRLTPPDFITPVLPMLVGGQIVVIPFSPNLPKPDGLEANIAYTLPESAALASIVDRARAKAGDDAISLLSAELAEELQQHVINPLQSTERGLRDGNDLYALVLSPSEAADFVDDDEAVIVLTAYQSKPLGKFNWEDAKEFEEGGVGTLGEGAGYMTVSLEDLISEHQPKARASMGLG